MKPELLISEMLMAFIDGQTGRQNVDYAATESDCRGMQNVLALLVSHGLIQNGQAKADQLMPAPTEAMCDAARGFIMGLDLECRTFAKMKRHLELGDYPSCRYLDDKAISTPNGHITKWDVADIIYQLIYAARPVAGESIGNEGRSVSG